MDKKSLSDSKAQLDEAIRKLEAFSSQHSETPSMTSVSKTISLVRSLLRDAFNANSKKGDKKQENPNKDDVLKAVELINRKRLLIQKLKKGSPAEQKLAESLTKAVDAYNQNREKKIQESHSSSKGLAKFLSIEKAFAYHELPEIDLPSQATVAYHYPPKEEFKSQKHTPTFVSLPKQSVELFHMKVLALLERYGIASNPEARNLVKQSPIVTAVAEDDSTYTLKQTITLFPGQTIVVMGTSTLDPKTQTISRLFPETFFVSLESTQPGFPHPSQRTGWALAHQLLPEYPQRIDLLQETASLFRGKKQAMQELLPHGPLIKKAKHLLQQKKKCFTAHSIEFLNLHKKLALSILKAAPAASILPHAYASIEQFFQTLACHHAPFEYLVDVNQCMRDIFLAKPHHHLIETILKGKSTALMSHDPHVRLEASKSILEQAFDEAYLEVAEHPSDKIKWNYIGCMGKIVGTAAIPIILQYLSEDLVFPPPQLNSFERKVQAVAYLQMGDFLKELSSDIPENIFELIKTQLESDLSIFAEEHGLAIPNELSEYFHLRYNNLIQ